MSLVNGKHQGAWFGIEPENAGQPTGEAGPYAGVVFNKPVDQVFTYRVPSRMAQALRPGHRVRVPFGRGNTSTIGYCVRVDDILAEGLDRARLKEVLEILDHPPLIDARMLELTRWLAGYYVCSWGQALDAVVPAGVKKQSGTRVGVFLTIPEEAAKLRETVKLTSKQALALEILETAEEPLSIPDLCRLAKCGGAVVAGLRKHGLVHTVKRRLKLKPEPPAEVETSPPARPDLTAEQRDVLDKIQPAIVNKTFTTFLIHGVTGSGKTEVYLSAIEEVVSRGGEAIVLVPEISLTPQTIRRFKRRFSKVAVLHSHLSDAERHRHWKSIAAGEIEVVVGARSAVFAPARRLGLIVIDEEHESTFKQETVPRYHARDVAVMRGRLEGVPVLLGSATPALETWRNSEVGRYTRLTMLERVGNRPMPEVTLIDLRNERPANIGLSGPLRHAMATALDDRGQVILLLNRRGFHTYAVCTGRECGKVLMCDSCDIALTYHKQRRILICHACDAERGHCPNCPSCGAKLYYGGIGTEQLEREVFQEFPDQVIRRMDSDTMRKPGSHEAVLSAFKAGEVDILLGTQMIAKGLDFPNVTLVGVIDADTALHMPDFRAAERTFQLVAQVAGRTGRGDRAGRVLVQTRSPEVPAIACAVHHDYGGFVENELIEREALALPPYGRLARVVGRGKDEAAVKQYMDELGSALKAVAPSTVKILGPAPAPVLKIRDLFRYHLRLTAPSPKPLHDILKRAPREVALPAGVELAIDVDPVSML